MTTTYLMGAGASAESLPVVNGITKALSDCIEQVDLMRVKRKEPFPEHITYRFFPVDVTRESANRDFMLRQSEFMKLKHVFKGLEKIATNHPSVDTYARKLFLSDSDDSEKRLHVFKCDLVLFFSFLELIRVPDKRYDLWLASILRRENDQLQLPNDVNIISWNYDSQIEKVFCQYLESSNQDQELNEALDLLQLFDGPGAGRYVDHSRSCYYKINGTARFYHPNPKETSNSRLKSSFRREVGYDQILFGQLVKDYEKAIQSFKPIPADGLFGKEDYEPDDVLPLLSFAWEEDRNEIDNIHPILRQTSRLIVIGYSFPDFNRSIDVELFEGTLLNELWIVTPESEVRVRERLNELFDETTSNTPTIKVLAPDKFPIHNTFRST
jgi:hypothetical protein